MRVEIDFPTGLPRHPHDSVLSVLSVFSPPPAYPMETFGSLIAIVPKAFSNVTDVKP